jgi:hypothetical protein
MLLNLQNKTYYIKFILVLFFIQSGSSSFAQWTLVLDKDDIRVYTKPTARELNYYKVETTINTQIEKLYKFFTNFSNYPKWVNNCSSVDVLEQTIDSNYIYYSYFDMPWPASDRDGVSDLKIVKLTSDTILVYSTPATLETPKKKNVIRVENFEERILLIKESENSVFLTMEGGYNAGGLIPDWLVRKMMKYGPYDVVVKIKKLVE